MVDSIVGIEGVISTSIGGNKQWNVFLELDCGYGRCKLACRIPVFNAFLLIAESDFVYNKLLSVI